MTLRVVCVLLATISTSQLTFAAIHQDVTPYEDLQTQLVLRPGQTYLAFMKNEVKPAIDSYQEIILDDPATQSRNYKLLQKNLISKGAGVAIRINKQNYIFNVGYLDGSDPRNDVKSGRSYGVGPAGTESDPSDLAYLEELEDYLQSEPGAAGEFVETLMRVIVNCDPSGWSRLSAAGQAVATDFLAIYTAELDRHLMVNLNPKTHPWEIDLAAATFVSIFDAASGLIMQDGALVEGSIKLWWAKGMQGSGIGETRRDRIALQNLIAQVAQSLSEVREISEIVGKRAQVDVIQGVLEYLNSHEAPEDMTGEEGEKITQFMRKYLLHVQAHSNQIADTVR